MKSLARLLLATAFVSCAAYGAAVTIGPLAIPVYADMDFQNVNGVGPAILNLPARDDKQGVIELATQAEVNAGVDAVRAVTPATLFGATFGVKKFATTVGGATSIPLVHNLGTLDVEVHCYNIAAPSPDIAVEVQHTSTTTATLVFVVAPPAASLRCVVFG